MINTLSGYPSNNENSEVGIEGLQNQIDTKESIDDMVVKVQEELKKGVQMRSAIQSQSSKNQKLSQMLSYIFKNLTKDELIAKLYKFFFVFESNASNHEVLVEPCVAIFLPFYLDYSKENGVFDIFIDLNPSQVVQIAEYLDFIKRINLKYPELLSKDRGNYIDLIIEILKTYHLVNDSISDQEMQRKLYINIYKFFFNEEPLI